MNCAAQIGRGCEQVSLGSFLDRSGMIGKVEVRQCVHCKHGITYPPISDVTFLYGNRESQDYQPDTKNILSRWIKKVAFRLQAKKLIRQIDHIEGRVLDFGCGSGQFTRIMSELLLDTEVVGSDFFEEPPLELINHDYASSKTIAAQTERYDVVMAMHVLEHDDDIAGLLSKIAAPAKRGAKIVIEVPNVECIWNKVFGRFWDAWYVPHHRNHFSYRSLVSFLESSGLDIVAGHGVTAPTMGRTMANLFGGRNNLFWLIIGIVLHPVQLTGEILSGQRTAIRVIARKR